MANKLITKSKKIVFSQQSTVLSAATLIMLMVVIAKVLGFVKQRVLFTFFSPVQTDLFLAAFELPDLLFEIIVFGTVSAAFIPVFSQYLSKKDKKEAWKMASNSLNIVLSTYLVFATLVFSFAHGIYTFIAGDFIKNAIGIGGGFSKEEVTTVVQLTRMLLISQIFFVVGSFMTGILESHKRFLLPAVAPLIYNLGIIGGAIFLSGRFGIMGPVIGAFIGALGHLSVQLPLAYVLGFRFRPSINFKGEGVRKLLSLSMPRVIELSVSQIKRFVWLFLGSLVAGGFTYLKSAELLQNLPVSVFGISLAKAALPTFAHQAGKEDKSQFIKTFTNTFSQMLFLVVPVSVFLIVLRVPIVRLVFGAEQFDWPATLQTSYTISAFALGTFAYSASLLLSRAFYALHDTKTPVAVSIGAVLTNAVLGFVFVLGFSFETWGIALAYSIAGIIQFIFLTILLTKRLNLKTRKFLVPFSKIAFSSIISGSFMYFLLKIFDRSVWVKRLSFLKGVDAARYIPFESFVLDTRYTSNLVILTAIVSILGFALYIFILILLKSEEVGTFFTFVKRIVQRKIAPIPPEEEEQVTPPPTEMTA